MVCMLCWLEQLPAQRMTIRELLRNSTVVRLPSLAQIIPHTVKRSVTC